MRNLRHFALYILLAVLPLPASAVANYELTVAITPSGGGNTINADGGQANIQFFPLDNYSLFCEPAGISTVSLVRIVPYAGTERTVKNNFNGSYTLSLTIIDDDAVGNATVTFTGAVTGYMSQGESSLVHTFGEPRTKAVTINGQTYTVTIGPFVSPGAPITSNPGLINATITCAPSGTAVSSVTLPAGTVSVGQAIQGTVALDGPAARGGAVVALTSGTPASVQLPATVTVEEGTTSATFIGAAKAPGTNVNVQAQWNATTASKSLSVGAGATCGDTNGDGQVTLADVVRWLRAVAGLDTMPNC